MTTPTTSGQGLVIAAPASLLQFCEHMDMIKTRLAAVTDRVVTVQRSLQFISERYQQSALGKKRQAKLNLTAACNHALVSARKTLHEIAATFATPCTHVHAQLHVLLCETHQANAPNTQTDQRILRQQLKVATIRT
jgi:hypothetical protein